MSRMRVGFWSFYRTKSNVALICMLSISLAIFEIVLFYQKVLTTPVAEETDHFTSTTIFAFDFLANSLLVVILLSIPFIWVLKLRDNMQYNSLLKSLGFTSVKIVWNQAVELFLMLLCSFLLANIVFLVLIFLFQGFGLLHQIQFSGSIMLMVGMKTASILFLIFFCILVIMGVYIKFLKPLQFRDL